MSCFAGLRMRRKPLTLVERRNHRLSHKLKWPRRKWARRVCGIVVRRVSLLVETEENGLVFFFKRSTNSIRHAWTNILLAHIWHASFLGHGSPGNQNLFFQRRWVHKASQTLRGCQAGDVEMESKGACDDFLWKQSCDEKNPWIKNHWNGPGDLIHLLRIGNKSVQEIDVFQNSFGKCDQGSRFKICF